MYNRFIGIGRLVRDPSLKYTPNGTAVANFTLAINRKFNKDETDFIDCQAWKGLAENCANYLKKGSLAAVEGRIQVRTYENQEGQKRKVTEVVADDVRFLDSKNKSDSSSPSPSNLPDNWKDIGTALDLSEADFID